MFKVATTACILNEQVQLSLFDYKHNYGNNGWKEETITIFA